MAQRLTALRVCQRRHWRRQGFIELAAAGVGLAVPPPWLLGGFTASSVLTPRNMRPYGSQGVGGQRGEFASRCWGTLGTVEHFELNNEDHLDDNYPMEIASNNQLNLTKQKALF